MKPASVFLCTGRRRIGRGIAAPVVLGLGLLAGSGCRPPAADIYQGYLEGEFVYVAAPLPGRLVRLAVSRGDEVGSGELLFELEAEPEAAVLAEAEQVHARAAARLEDLRKGLRPTEIAALEARLTRAEADWRWARTECARLEQLWREGVISVAELDRVRARQEADAALVASLRAELETARLGAREDEIRAAEAELAAAAAARDRARWALDNKRRTAPVAGRVHDTLYRVGEFVAAGLPVVALLPPENLKARFFVPEPMLDSVRIGDRIRLRVDGRDAPVPATISHVATQAEYTPPVIYSRENRARLVFMVEAALPPEAARELKAGQPVEVTIRAP